MYYPDAVVTALKRLQEAVVNIDPSEPRALVASLSFGLLDRSEEIAKREVGFVWCAVENGITETAQGNLALINHNFVELAGRQRPHVFELPVKELGLKTNRRDRRTWQSLLVVEVFGDRLSLLREFNDQCRRQVVES